MSAPHATDDSWQPTATAGDHAGPLHISIVVVGDEILRGHIAESNASFMLADLRGRDLNVDQVRIVGDAPEEISQALKEELARPRRRLILTAGGTGSTPDDVTYAATAMCLGQRLSLNGHLQAMVEAAAADMEAAGFAVSEEDRAWLSSMARIPSTAFLAGNDGWSVVPCTPVDGGHCTDGGVTIASLPGVPEYARSVWAKVVVPLLLPSRPAREVSLDVPHDLPEPLVAAAIDGLVRQHDGVRAGSYTVGGSLIRLSGPADVVSRAARDLDVRLRLLSGTVR